jgi:hypothetical protein
MASGLAIQQPIAAQRACAVMAASVRARPVPGNGRHVSHAPVVHVFEYRMSPSGACSRIARDGGIALNNIRPTVRSAAVIRHAPARASRTVRRAYE